MRTSTLAALLAAVLAAGIASAQQGPDFARDDEKACKSVSFETVPPLPKNDKDSKGKVPSYSAHEILDLRLTIKLGNPHRLPELLDLRFYTPNGHLYESRVVAIRTSAEEARGATHRNLRGYPHPVEAQTPKETGKGAGLERTVTATLPVGGTLISTNSLYGRWRVDVHADGAPTPCASAPFAITP